MIFALLIDVGKYVFVEIIIKLLKNKNSPFLQFIYDGYIRRLGPSVPSVFLEKMQYRRKAYEIVECVNYIFLLDIYLDRYIHKLPSIT